MQPFYMLTAVDVRRATEPETSRATTISKLPIPSLSFATASHNPGGSVMAVDFTQPRLEAPEPKFEAKGIDIEIFRGMGQRERWVFAGAYVNKAPGGGRPVPGRCIIEGAITGWEPDDSDPAEFQGCTHTFKEVTHIEFSIDGRELFYVDVFERVLRVDGADMFEDQRRALGI